MVAHLDSGGAPSPRPLEQVEIYLQSASALGYIYGSECESMVQVLKVSEKISDIQKLSV